MTKFPRQLRFWTALMMVAFLSTLNVGPVAAGLAPSRPSGETTITSARTADMLITQRALESKLVVQKLRDYGVGPADAQARLASMSDRDLHTLASATKGLPSGGDATGAVIGILLIVILVIVILQLTHHSVIVR